LIRRMLGTTGFALTLFVVAACGGGAASTAGPPTPATSAQTVTFTETEFKIDPATPSLKAGSYAFEVVNKGSFPHDLHVATADGTEIARSSQINGGQTTTFQVALRAGTYTIWCAVDGHRARGMEGKVTVS
jgi:plastocyanin